VGLVRGLLGGLVRRIPASAGVRPPFRTLHRTQAQTMFSQSVRPPRLRGMTWSRLSSPVGNFLPQYWQRLPSLAKGRTTGFEVTDVYAERR